MAIERVRIRSGLAAATVTGLLAAALLGGQGSAAADPADGTGSAPGGFGSSSLPGLTIPGLTATRVSRLVKWEFPPANYGVNYSVSVSANDDVNRCVDDHTGDFSFSKYVSGEQADTSRSDSLSMVASASFAGGCFISDSAQSWTIRVSATDSKGSIDKYRYKNRILNIRFVYSQGDLNVRLETDYPNTGIIANGTGNETITVIFPRPIYENHDQ